MGKRRKTLVVLATLIGTFLAALDATVVGTAMPTIIGELGGLPLYPWAFASYLLAATVTGPVFGKLSDTYGRKPVYLAGIFLFLLGSVLAGASQSMAALIAFRTVQGLGAGAVQPVAITIIGDIFELETRARIQGATTVGWIALIVIATLPLIFGEMALIDGGLRMASAEAEMVRQGAVVSTLPDAERQRWIRGLPNLAKTWADSSGPAARDVLAAYFKAIRDAGQTPGRDWDRELAA